MSELRIKTAKVFEPLLETARYKGAEGGRGSGKSRQFAGMMVEETIAEQMDCVCLREVQKSLEFSVKKELVATIQEWNVGQHFDIQDRRIKTKTGGVIIFEGLQNHTAESLKSFSGFKRAWVEEAQSLSAQSLKILRPTIRASGSQLWFSWNPKYPTDPVDEFFKGTNPPPDSVLVKANYMDNPWLPDELRQEMEWDRVNKPDDFAHVWLGDYEEHSEARVFRNWKIEEFDLPASSIFRLGADWGFSVDPSVMVRCCIEGRRLYVDQEAYRLGCEIDELPDLFMQIPGSEKWPSTADSARPETISYMRKHGFPKMGPAMKGANSLPEGVQFLQSFEIVVHPRCEHTIRELTLYKYKKDPKTDQILPILEDKNNHCIDALRYACEGARRAGTHKPIPERKPKPRLGAGSWLGN